MTFEEFRQKMAGWLQDKELRQTVLLATPESSLYDDLGFDSLDVTEILTGIDMYHGVHLNEEQITRNMTLQGLYELVAPDTR